MLEADEQRVILMKGKQIVVVYASDDLDGLGTVLFGNYDSGLEYAISVNKNWSSHYAVISKINHFM